MMKSGGCFPFWKSADIDQTHTKMHLWMKNEGCLQYKDRSRGKEAWYAIGEVAGLAISWWIKAALV